MEAESSLGYCQTNLTEPAKGAGLRVLTASDQPAHTQLL
jgi:hypothetical protein